MDVVIAIFGDTGTELSGLRKSIDSILKDGEGLNRLVVIGSVPSWVGVVDGKVERYKIPPMRYGMPKHDLIMDGLIKAIRDGVVAGDFLYCPLGVTLQGPTDLNAYPRYCRRGKIRSVAEMVVAGKGGAVITKYWLSVTDTRQVLERNGFSAIDFSGKFLSHIDADDVLDVESLWIQEPHAAFGYEPACLFGNVRESKVAENAPRWVEWNG